MPKRKSKIKTIRGRKSRAAGARLERKVRGLLEKDGWIVLKNSNNVIDNQFKQARQKYNPFTKRLMSFTGFPDFIAFRLSKGKKYEIIGVEVKGGGWLEKSEKEKCRFLLDKKIFSKILIAKKGKKRGQIEYIDFAKKYNKA
jgi:hypothetical protein